MGSFGKHEEVYGDINDMEGIVNDDDALQQSFFQNLPEVIVESTNDFNLEEEVKNGVNKNVNNELDLGIGAKNDLNFNPNNDILFSGYFGQKMDDENINGNKLTNDNHKRTNPFPMIVEERVNKNSFNLYNKPNFKKQRLDKSLSLNNSYISTTSSKAKNSFSDMVKSVSLTTCPKKSKKYLILEILSSVELELLKIKKEKENIKKLQQKNEQMKEKVKIFNFQIKQFTPKPIISTTPLTMLKPFNLQTEKLLSKKRTSEINSKIAEQMKTKTEPKRIKFISKSPVKKKSIDDEVNSLSNRIERYCIISKRSKSPLKLCFNENEDKNFENMKASILNETFVNSTSIRKHFDTEKLISTEDKKALQKTPFRAKLVKKIPEIKSFEDIIEKSRKENKFVEKIQKANKVNQKIEKIKTEQFNFAEFKRNTMLFKK
jgi:hypothetical protein